MISHVVLMKPRPDLTSDDRRAFIAAFHRALREISSVRGVRIGTRVRIGAHYEAIAPDAGDYLAIIDFDDLAGLRAYLAHPAHAELGARFYESLTSAIAFDYDVGGIEALDRL